MVRHVIEVNRYSIYFHEIDAFDADLSVFRTDRCLDHGKVVSILSKSLVNLINATLLFRLIDLC